LRWTVLHSYFLRDYRFGIVGERGGGETKTHRSNGLAGKGGSANRGNLSFLRRDGRAGGRITDTAEIEGEGQPVLGQVDAESG